MATALIKDYLLNLQNRVCSMLEEEEGSATFLADEWQRPEGGGGLTRILQDGKVIEKAGVNFSHVTGESLPPSASASRPELAGRSFQALGVSLIVHPRNPYAPTTHCNVRYFCAEKPGEEPVWWFGGGFDLTPIYGFEEDCVFWHEQAKAACDPIGADLYPRFKKWADDYFYLPHRQEARGVGGLFYDDFNELDFEKSFHFTRNVGDHFISAYQPILNRRKETPYGERERAFQSLRHGRYVEFNLVYDRGTHFGLQSGGRTESILASMPKEVTWLYDFQPEVGSAEAQLTEQFLPVRDWI